MMYTNTPSQEASEAFLTYYLGEIHRYWETPVGLALPVLKTIAESADFTKDANQVKIVQEWVPVCKTYAALKTEAFAALASVDGGQALTQFAQTMLQGTTDPKAALTTPAAGPRSGREVAAANSRDVMTPDLHGGPATAAPPLRRRAGSAGAPSRWSCWWRRR